jgi:hypothetical protein
MGGGKRSVAVPLSLPFSTVSSLVFKRSLFGLSMSVGNVKSITVGDSPYTQDTLNTQDTLILKVSLPISYTGLI